MDFSFHQPVFQKLYPCHPFLDKWTFQTHIHSLRKKTHKFGKGGGDRIILQWNGMCCVLTEVFLPFLFVTFNRDPSYPCKNKHVIIRNNGAW